MDIPMMVLQAAYDTVKDISLPVLLLLLVTTIISSLIFVRSSQVSHQSITLIALNRYTRSFSSLRHFRAHHSHRKKRT
jgi:hypothetical protein